MNKIIQDPQVRLAALWTFLFSLLAQGYRWFNLSFFHDSLIVWQNDGLVQLAFGRFLVPVYLLLRGEIAAPLLIATFSVCFLVLADILLVRILDLHRPLHIILLCALVSSCPKLTLLYSTYLSAADLHCLGIFLSVLSVWLFLRSGRGWIPAAVSLAASMAFYPTCAEVAVVLLMLLLIKDLVLGQHVLLQAATLWKAFAFLAVGGALYYAGWKLSLLLISGTDAAAQAAEDCYSSLNQLGHLRLADLPALVKGTYFNFLHYVHTPEVLHYRLIAMVNLLIGAGACVLAALTTRKMVRLLPIALLVLLLPLGADFAYIFSEGLAHSLMVFSIDLLPAGALMVLEFPLREGSGKAVRRVHTVLGAVTALCLCFFAVNCIVSANQCHVKKALEQQATLSVITRVLDRIEQTEGYEAGKTLVVLAGDLNKSSIAQERGGYDYDPRNFWLKDSFSMTYFESYRSYFRNVLGYPILLGDRDTTKEFCEMSEVLEMPAFPETGCIKMIDGVLVVKLSESLSLQSNKEKRQKASDGY